MKNIFGILCSLVLLAALPNCTCRNKGCKKKDTVARINNDDDSVFVELVKEEQEQEAVKKF